MKAIFFGIAAAALAAASGGASAQVYGDVARVVSATPVYERAAPQRDCRTEQVVSQAPAETGSGVGAVLGAVVGGVIGHQFGGSTAGRDHGTAAGAVIGGLVGNQVEKDSQGDVQRVREVQRCTEVPGGPDRIVAYDVRYEYNGHEFRTRLPFDPGPEMAVNVDVRPPAAEAMAPRRPMYRGPY